MIVNDGSPDNSQKIINKYCKKDSRVRSFVKENGGISSARNYGLKYSKGKYIWFVDSDDYIDVGEFESFFQEVQREEADIFIGNYYFLKEDRKVRAEELFPDKTILSGKEVLKKKGQEIMARSYVWKNLYNKKFLEKNTLFFDEDIIIEDQLFTVISFLKAEKIKYIDNCIYYYRVGRVGSIMTSLKEEQLKKSIFKICKETLNYTKEISGLYYVKRIIQIMFIILKKEIKN